MSLAQTLAASGGAHTTMFGHPQAYGSSDITSTPPTGALGMSGAAQPWSSGTYIPNQFPDAGNMLGQGPVSGYPFMGQTLAPPQGLPNV